MKLEELSNDNHLLELLHLATQVEKDCTVISNSMKSKRMRGIINRYLKERYETSLFSDTDKQNLYFIIQIAQYLYSYSTEDTGLSDIEYDIIYEMYINLDGDEMISVPLPSNVMVSEHLYTELRGTLAKVYQLDNSDIQKNPSRKYLHEWISSMQKMVGDKYDLSSESVYVFPKWDGTSCVIYYDKDGSMIKALTRGDTYENLGEDISHIIPDKYRFEEFSENGKGVQYEIMVKISDWEEYNQRHSTTYKSPRSITTAIMRSKHVDSDMRDILTLIPLREFYPEDNYVKLHKASLGEYPYAITGINRTNDIRELADLFEENWGDKFKRDGIVLRFENEELCKLLGRSNDMSNYEVAYKFSEEIVLTKLIDVTFQVGLLGSISPVANIEPVVMRGNKISSISLGSMERFHALGLRPGDTVKILYEIIPYLVFDDSCKHSKKKKIDAPILCPICQFPLETNESGFFVRCNNPVCSCRLKGRIVNYIQKIGIDNISIGTVDALYNQGYLESIYDLYTLRGKRERLMRMDGFGTTRVTNILDAIDAKKNIHDYTFLGAIGISGCSTETFKAILSVYNLSELMDICELNDTKALCEIPGIKTAKATKIINGIMTYKEEIKKTSMFLSLSHPEFKDAESRFSVCFTGIRNKEVEAKLIELGGIVHNTLKHGTTYLVIPDKNYSSVKTKKAEDWGIEVVPISSILKKVR